MLSRVLREFRSSSFRIYSLTGHISRELNEQKQDDRIGRRVSFVACQTIVDIDRTKRNRSRRTSTCLCHRRVALAGEQRVSISSRTAVHSIPVHPDAFYRAQHRLLVDEQSSARIGAVPRTATDASAVGVTVAAHAASAVPLWWILVPLLMLFMCIVVPVAVLFVYGKMRKGNEQQEHDATRIITTHETRTDDATRVCSDDKSTFDVAPGDYRVDPTANSMRLVLRCDDEHDRQSFSRSSSSSEGSLACRHCQVDSRLLPVEVK
jgi:hypothetical protein